MRKWLSVFACLIMAAAVFSFGRADAQTAAEVDGEWRGERSGNRVAVTLRPGGIEARRITTNPGQSPAAFFRQTGPGEFRLAFADGSEAVLRFTGPNTHTVTNPDGWSDTFHRVSAPPAAAASTSTIPTQPSNNASSATILGGYCGEVTWAGQAPVDAWIIIRPGERWRAPSTAGPFTEGPEGAYTQNGNMLTFRSDEGPNYTITASVAGGRIIGEVTANDGRRGVISMTQMVGTNAAVRSSPVPPDFVLTSAARALQNDMDGLDRFVAWTWTPQGVDYWRAIRGAGALTPDAAEAVRDWIRRTEAGERPQCDAQ